MTEHILVAEDDEAIRRGLVDTLESEAYSVKAASDGAEALARLREENFDLLVLDVMMPGRSGYDVCRELRGFDSTLPVLMLTAKGEEIDKVVGLELGADDYMTKPFGVREFLARVHALLRRSRATPSSPDAKTAFDFGPWRIDPKTFTATREQRAKALTSRELHLLRVFSDHPGEVLSRDELLNTVWGIDYYGTTRTLDQHIAKLRAKLEADRSAPRLILTVHGVGYRHGPVTE